MAYQVHPLHPLFAAELIGADCANPTPELVATVESLMAEHAVLCIRGQGHIDDEQHLAFARKFGPLELPGHKPHNGGRVAFGLYDVSNLNPDGSIADADGPRAKISKGNELFHADSSFNDLPSKWSMLRGVIVTPEGGETETIDMRAVYDALPQAMKDRIAGLTVGEERSSEVVQSVGVIGMAAQRGAQLGERSVHIPTREKQTPEIVARRRQRGTC